NRGLNSYEPQLPLLIRYSAAGTFDSAFSHNVLVAVNPADYFVGALDIAVQSDGRILVAAAGSHPGDISKSHFFVFRFNADGTLDTTFDGDGVATVDFGTTNDA